MPRQVIVIGPARILHRYTHRMLAGMLARRHRRNIDPHKLAHIPRQGRCRTIADFFGDGKQWMTVDKGLFATVDNGFQGGEQGRHTRLVIQMPRTDMATFGKFRQWVEGHEITDIDPQRIAIRAGGAVGIQAQLDMVPTDRQFIHAGIEGVARSH